jgi:hypothetical protein
MVFLPGDISHNELQLAYCCIAEGSMLVFIQNKFITVQELVILLKNILFHLPELNLAVQ